MVRRALVALLVMGAVGAVLVGLVVRQLRTSPVTERAAPLLPVEPQALRLVELTNRHGAFTLQRRDGEWWLTAPVETPADRDAVESLLQHLGELPRSAPVRGASEELERLGLKEPVATVILQGSDGERTGLRMGIRNDFHGQVYVQLLGQEAVQLTDGALAYQLERNLLQWRDRRLWRGTQEQLQSLEATGPGARWELQRTGDGFVVSTHGDAHPADTARVRTLLSDLVGLRARRFVREHSSQEEAEQEAGGPAPWQLRIEHGEGAQTWLHLWPSGYGWVAPQGPLVELSGSAIFGALPESAQELQDKRLLRFDRDQVDRIEVRSGGTAFTLRRLPPEGDHPRWQWEQGPRHGPARAAEVFALLYKLWTLSYEPQVSAAPPPWHPRGTIRLLGRSGEVLAEVTLGPQTLHSQWVSVGHRKLPAPLAKASGIALELEAYQAP